MTTTTRDRWKVAVLVALLFLAPPLVALLVPLRAEAALSEAEVWEIAAEAWPPAQVQRAVRVARCESTFEPTALATGWDRRFGFYRQVGLWQIEAVVWQPLAVEMFGPDADLTDARVNAHVAAAVWRQQGWAVGWPWCSR